MLKYLAEETKFNFELKDRWNNDTFDEMKNKLSREQIKTLRKIFEARQARLLKD